LPGVFDVVRVATYEKRNDVLLEIGRHGEFAAVECRIADSDYAVRRGEAQSYKIAARASNEHFGFVDFH